jgi:hypothetical protein
MRSSAPPYAIRISTERISMHNSTKDYYIFKNMCKVVNVGQKRPER